MGRRQAHRGAAAAAAITLLAAAALLSSAATPASAAKAKTEVASRTVDLAGVEGGPKLQLRIKEHDLKQQPPTVNPYAGQAYAGCDGGFCPPEDADLEHEFWEAAETGNAKLVKKLLGRPALNLTRNIVPDDAGLARVADVAVWAAANNGHTDVMKALLEHKGVREMYEYEDGHIVDLAAAKGAASTVEYLLSKDMPVSPQSMAHAAHYNHTEVMMLLLNKPLDLKSAMQAITGGGSAGMASLLAKVMGLQEEVAAKKAGHDKSADHAHDWHAEYIHLAVEAGNLPVLKVLLSETGYQLTWQAAQDIIKAAAEKGDAEVMSLLLEQKVFAEDSDELDEAVDNALKVAGEMGSVDIIELLAEKHGDLAESHCKAAVFRALKFSQSAAFKQLSRFCKVDTTTPKLQEATWFGDLYGAARSGDAAKVKELLGHKKARSWIKKLQQQEINPKTGRPAGLAHPHPKQDPVIIAAIQGHLGVVEQLADFRELCAACAAGEASKANHSDIVRHLIAGPAKFIMANADTHINYALRIVAYAMEAQNWELVEHMIREHQSIELGPYFLIAIAQEGKIADLHNMTAILAKVGYDKTPYFKEQVYSAMITAALGGHVDILMELNKHTGPLSDEEVAAAQALKQAKDPQDENEAYGNLDEFMGQLGAPPARHEEL